MDIYSERVNRNSTHADENDRIQEAYQKVLISEAERHLQMWAKTTKKDGKTGKLIAYWDDLGAYYDIDGTTWYYSSNRKWANKGDTEKFKKAMKAGKWRGKLIESESLDESSNYTTKIKGIPSKAFKLFKEYGVMHDIKKMGFRGFNISQASISDGALSDLQRAKLLKSQYGEKFDHAQAAKFLEKTIPMLQKKWKEIQKQAHQELYGKDPGFGDYKVSGIGDSDYAEKYRKQLRTLAHMETKFKYALGGHAKAARMKK